MPKIALLLLHILIVAAVQGQSERRANSIFWEITGEQMSQPSYLYGTMHVSSKIAFKLPEQFFTLLEGVDIVALESVPDQWERDIAEDSTLHYLTQVYQHREASALHGGYDFYTGLVDVFDISKGHLKWLLSRKSTQANQLLFRNNPFGGDLTEQTYLDLYIYQMGKKLNKEVLGLEEVRTSTLKAYKASLIEYAKVDNGNNRFDDAGRIVTDAYKAKDITKIDSVYKKAYSEGYLENLLYSRNEDMLASFIKMTASGKSVFMAVGAAHLAGERGLLSMLEEKGYTVRPITETSYYDPSNALLKFDTIYVPSQAEPHWSIDSSLYFEAPGYAGRRVETGLVEYLCTDMTNGVYYRLDRVPLFHGFIDNGDLPERVDSLLYESTSGKILSKEKIKIDGYPAIKVSSRNPEAKQVWSLYIFTPYELLIAEVQGPEKWQGDEQAEHFLASIKTQYRTQTTPYRNGALQLDIAPTILDFPYSEFDLNMPNLMSYGTDGKHDYLLIRSKRHGQEGIEKDLYETRALIHSFAKLIHAKVSSVTSIEIDGRTATQATLKNKLGSIEVQSRVRGENYFLMATNDTKSKFKKTTAKIKTDLLPPDDDLYLYTNDTLGYALQTYVKPYGNVLNPYIFLREVQHSSFARGSKKTLHVNYFQYPRYGYDVEVSLKQVNPYTHFESRDSLWDKYDDYILNEFVFGEDGSYEVTDSLSRPMLENRVYKIKDSGSSTYTLVSITLTDDKEYVLSAILDTSSALSTKIAEQLRSFKVEPQGKIYSLSSTLDTFVSHMYSEDSLTKEIFEENRDKFTASTEDIPHIIELLDTSKVLQSRQKQYYDMLGYLSVQPSPETFAFLEKLYKENENNFETQFEILEVLGNMKDSSATYLFKKLLLGLPPLESASASSSSAGVFSVLTSYRLDSTLTPLLYPEIMELMDYDEYYSPITSMTALQSRFYHLDTSLYSSKVSYFYKKLRAEYRRQATQETLLQKDAKYINENSEASNDYNDKRTYSIETGRFEDTYVESAINTYSYYKLFSYYEILSRFRHRPEVAQLLTQIDNSPNTDLQLYRSLDRMEDSLDYDTEPLKEHMQRERYGLALAQTLINYGQDSTLNTVLPGVDSFALWLFKKKLRVNDEKDTLSLDKKLSIKHQDENQKIFVYRYKKEGYENELYALLGFFRKGQNYLNKYIWLEDINLQELHKSLEDFVAELQPQFDAIDRAFVSPSDFKIYKEPEFRDPFRFMLYN